MIADRPASHPSARKAAGSPSGHDGAPPSEAPPDRPSTGRLYLWALAAALCTGWLAIGAPYGFDDLDVLDVVALWRLGAYRLVDLLFLPHNEHLIPAWRLLFSASTWFFGADARFFHLALLALHAAGAWAVGRLALAAGAGRVGVLASTLLYAAGAGFAGSAVWYPTGAVVMGAWVAVLLGLTRFYRVGAPPSPGRTALFSIGGLAATTGALPGLAAPWLAFVLASFGEKSRARTLARRTALALPLAGLAVLVFMRADYAAYANRPFPSPSLSGLPAFFAILASAPGQFLTTAGGVLIPPVSWRAAASVVGWLLAAFAFWRAWRSGRTGRDLLLSLWAGSAALAFAVGLNRPDLTFAALPNSNRYYYPFTAPLALSFGLLLDALATRIASRFRGSPAPGGETPSPRSRLAAAFSWDRIAVLLVAIPFVLGQAASFRQTLPSPPHDASPAFWRAAAVLSHLLEAEAARPGAPPWTLTDGLFPFPGIHDGSLAFSTIFRTHFPRPIAGERFALAPPGTRIVPGVSADDLRRENEVLDRWADAVGAATVPVCATPSGLVAPTAAAHVADFRASPRDDVALFGLYTWEPPFRWMGPTARLRLKAAPGDLIVRAWMPPPSTLSRPEPTFTLTAKAAGRTLGTFRFDPAGGEQLARFPLTEPLAPDGSSVVIVLTADPVWRPSETMPGSRDTRELTVGLFVVGFSGDPLERPVPMRCLSGGEASGIAATETAAPAPAAPAPAAPATQPR